MNGIMFLDGVELLYRVIGFIFFLGLIGAAIRFFYISVPVLMIFIIIQVPLYGIPLTFLVVFAALLLMNYFGEEGDAMPFVKILEYSWLGLVCLTLVAIVINWIITWFSKTHYY